MFDWNDEELTNIIWDEAGESDDHIVPFQEGSEDYRNKKEWSQETANIKPSEQKTRGAKLGVHGGKLESGSNLNIDGGISTPGIGVGSWPDLSLSNVPKTDQDSLGTEVSNNLAEITKYSSTSGETGGLDKDPEFFQDPHEGKEQGDLVDYSWANIGSFDDLDRFFSNGDPIFGNVNLGTAEELWSSSKDVTNSPAKAFPATADSSSLGLGALRSIPGNFQIKTEYEQQDNQSFTLAYGKIDEPAPYSLQNLESPADKNVSIQKEQTGAETGGKGPTSKSDPAAENLTTSNELADNEFGQKKLWKFRKGSDEIVEGNMLQDFYNTWPPSGNLLGQYEDQMESFMVNSSPSPFVRPQKQLQGTDSLQFQQISTPFVVPSGYRNLRTPYPVMTVLSSIQPGEFKQQPVVSSYDAPPAKANAVNRSAKAPAKPLTMTPQEKIEKLRRRQQMQALLAIQKQQKQFSHQVSCTDHSISQKYAEENQTPHVEGNEVDDLSTLPSLDPLSPMEQDDSNTTSVAIDDYSVEETLLYRLEDIISKLDIRIRLCMRDSLFRLAQSAMQRHYSIDTSRTNKGSRDENEVAIEETKNHNRMSGTETETNPIDRTVAHLLFHRPLELSGKHPEMPESPASTKFSSEHKTVGFMNYPMGGMPESSKPIITLKGPQNPCSLVDPQPADQFENSPCIDTSENASNFGPAEGGIAEVEASQ
ncbi:hypothetical protein SLEP1_g11301 [Rubroshorea leprosula]|uniref:Protein LNK2 n=1 Tax=Rubroshorea leprosula TaxID=152421 RepID=A0AAV5IKZ1_9ROSI|nr:hypothetical protein SLEP1_g11301 [Rubroshorea leprosula]